MRCGGKGLESFSYRVGEFGHGKRPTYLIGRVPEKHVRRPSTCVKCNKADRSVPVVEYEGQTPQRPFLWSNRGNQVRLLINGSPESISLSRRRASGIPMRIC